MISLQKLMSKNFERPVWPKQFKKSEDVRKKLAHHLATSTPHLKRLPLGAASKLSANASVFNNGKLH